MKNILIMLAIVSLGACCTKSIESIENVEEITIQEAGHKFVTKKITDKNKIAKFVEGFSLIKKPAPCGCIKMYKVIFKTSTRDFSISLSDHDISYQNESYIMPEGFYEKVKSELKESNRL
jgi:hypothetical protein